MAIGIDTSALKSAKFWLALVAAIVGLLLANGVIVSGSLAAQIVGWITALLSAVLGRGATPPAPPAGS